MNFNQVSFQFKNRNPKDYGFIEQIMQQLRICKGENFILDVIDEFRDGNERLVVLEDKLLHQSVASFFQHNDDLCFSLNLPCDLVEFIAVGEDTCYHLELDTSYYPGVFGLACPLCVRVPADAIVNCSTPRLAS